MAQSIVTTDEQGPQTRATHIFDLLPHEDQLRLLVTALVNVEGSIPLSSGDGWNTLVRLGFLHPADDAKMLILTHKGSMAITRVVERYIL